MELLLTDTPIVLRQYCDFVATAQLFQSPGIPQPLTGYSFLSQVRKTRNDQSASPLGAFTVTVTDNTNGIVSITMPNATVTTLVAAAIAAGAPIINNNTQIVCYWDFRTTNASSQNTCWFSGPALLSLGVSH